MIPKDKQIFDEIKKIVEDAFNKISKSWVMDDFSINY